MCKKVASLAIALGLCLSIPASAANIVWVSFHPADNTASSGAAGAGFTTAVDKGYTDLLLANGFVVTRYVSTATPDAALLNAADLVIVSRSVGSGNYQDAAATRWNQITAPMMILNGYASRQNRMGFYTGNTIPDTTGDITLTVLKPEHPIFAGIVLTGNAMANPYAGRMNHPTTGAQMRGISIVTEAPNANGTILATVSAGSTTGPGGATVIAEWPAGVTVTHAGGDGTDTLGGPRLLFLTGSRETSGVNSETAGYFDLKPDGATMFINAVRYMTGDTGAAATSPTPADKATDVRRDASLSWTPGKFAATHDVYFGTSASDVNNASRTNPLGVLVSQGQDANTCDPAGLLPIGTTCYWRVDEVNAPPSTKIDKGAVWSFTVEPLSYPVANITASAFGSAAGFGPENTVNESGLDAADLHGTTDVTMWLGTNAAGQMPWIQYMFDRTYKLHEMWVWNYNVFFEQIMGLGLKDVAIEYGIDPNEWMLLGDFQFAQAPSAEGYAHNTTVDFGGVAAKYVRITAKSNWGGFAPQFGLSEVRFFYIPVQAREPQPASGTTGMDPSLTLSWRPGREAVSHQVYVSTDANAVIDGTAPVLAVNQGSQVSADVQFGATYSWKVVEVNDAASPSAWASDIWSFSTVESRSIDDFEDYTNDPPKRVFQTWIDGAGFSPDEFFPSGNPGNGSGALVGNDPQQGNIMETAYARGRQAMPFFYDNTSSRQSEVQRTWPTAQNWAGNGADSLMLYFRGGPIGFLQLSPTHILMNGTGTDLWGTADQGRFVYRQLSGNGSIVARVDRLDETNGWSKAGVMIRQSLDASSTWAMSVLGAANGARFQLRLTPATQGTTDSAIATPEQIAVRAPVWLKVERTGDTFNGYYATVEAPTTWIASPLGPQTITMGADVFIGLAVTSHATGRVSQAEFSEIVTTGNVTGEWQSADLGIAQPAGNTPEPLYVTLEDTGGNKATAVHADPYAVGAGAWTPWNIPLTTFTTAGVQTDSIKKMTIGVGDSTEAASGATGLIYIDDIGYGRPALAQ